MSATVVYCLATPDERHTYAGVTCKLKHRLRQHNGEIKGGARATRISKDWRLIYHVSGLPDRKTALQLEWRLHRRRGVPKSTIFGTSRAAQRAFQLYSAFCGGRFTSSAPAILDLDNVCIHWHKEEFHDVAIQQCWPVSVRHVCEDMPQEIDD